MGSKLTSCKTCGAEIAKTAKICPQCGAKQHQGTYAVCAVVIVVCALLCVFAIFVGSDNTPGKNNVQEYGHPATSETENNDHAATDILTDSNGDFTAAAENENLILGPGTYTVGQDIDAGKYDCIAVSGFGVLRGEIASADSVGFTQTMGSVSSSIGGSSASIEGSESYRNLVLADGDVIYIDMSLNVEFIKK